MVTVEAHATHCRAAKIIIVKYKRYRFLNILRSIYIIGGPIVYTYTIHT